MAKQKTTPPPQDHLPKSPKLAKRRKPKPELGDDVIQVLLEVAANTRELAYAPYSHYHVGAALLGESGLVYGGCNVENAAYPMSICAERTALTKAISEGEQKFLAIAVVTKDGGSPCGACRQMLAEFGLDIDVIIADEKGKYTLTTTGDLLPLAFRLR
ncbi:MAG TPA: cytidine deaminase [Thermoflexales bacterium]|nr:cytidine deaminase [Thermoflexales bacterium]HQW35502.1 cytidine deaminase [Thermoflexales bacterium]HQX75996.1 cytidine deaminase [Thermoflexales bacterium]HQZ22286.1 cytidine deaminase [Thermoflexales bacterium]